MSFFHCVATCRCAKAQERKKKQHQNEYIARADFLTSQHPIEGAMSTEQHTKWTQRKWNSTIDNLHNVMYNNGYNFTDEDR